MWKSLCVVVPMFAITLPVQADIYKCAGAKGLVTYQNFPCHIKSIGSSATSTAPTEPDHAPAAQTQPATRPTRVAPTQISGAPKPEPRVGMTVDELRATSWGVPDQVVLDKAGDDTVKTWQFSGNRNVVVNSSGRVVRVER